MTTCYHCQTDLALNAAFCPECGTQVDNPKTMQSEAPYVHFEISGSSKFFMFLHPLLNTIDEGSFFKKPFQWLYLISAIGCLCAPLYLLGKAVENNVFDMLGFSAVLLWLFIALAGWICFQIYWSRSKTIDTYIKEGDEFAAIPSIAHYIQTTGEGYGFAFGIIGFGLNLTLLLSKEGRYVLSSVQDVFPFLPSGFTGLLLAPLIGFFIIVFFRMISELLRSVAAIANNTKRTH